MINGKKCDLHRHLGGSISADTVVKILERTGKLSGQTHQEIAHRMQCDGFGIGFAAFLNKFTILDEIDWPEWAVDLSAAQICDDLKSEGILYTELSATISKYVKCNNWSPEHTVVILSDAFKKHAERTGVDVKLLLSLRYDSLHDTQIYYSKMIQSNEIRDRLFGLDLVGNEEFFDAQFYKPIFDRWREYGKVLRAHVGEMPGTDKNVIDAINILRVNRIAHGIQSSDDTLKLAAQNGIIFDLALHSNMITGACEDMRKHPIKKMLDYGCKVTLNTDDPIQFKCTLEDEFRLALDRRLITSKQAWEISNNALIKNYIDISNPSQNYCK